VENWQNGEGQVSDTISGFVAKTFAKEFNTKKGGTATAYSCKLESAETGQELPKFYQYGFKPLPFKKGDYVELQVKPKNDAADEITGGKIVKNPPARRPKQEAATFGGASDGNKKPWAGKGGTYAARDAQFAEKDRYAREHTQPRIQYQAARNAAIEAVAVLLANDGLPTSKAATKAGASTRFEDIVEYINKLTVQFHYDTETLRLLGAVVDSGVIESITGVNSQRPEAEAGTADKQEADEIVDDPEDEGDTSFGS
jgi:hypothetical protein